LAKKTAARMPTVAKTMISMPAGLKAEMDAARDAGLVENWSEVFAVAAKAKLAAVGKIPGEARIRAIAARIKAVRDAKKEELAAIGFADGATWAEVRADMHELMRLASLVSREEGFDHHHNWGDRWGLDGRVFFDPNHGLFIDASKRLHAYIAGTLPDLMQSEAFWVMVRGLDPSRAHLRVQRTDEYVNAFALAACEVWYDVRDLVMGDLFRDAVYKHMS
jgi:hypothetical protein